jgi:hypothetical protein
MSDTRGRILDWIMGKIIRRHTDQSIEMSAEDRMHIAKLRQIIRGDITDPEEINLVFIEVDQRQAETTKAYEDRVTALEDRFDLPHDGTLNERIDRLERAAEERNR